MVQDSIDSSDRDRQINEIISDYLGSVDAGQVTDRQEWLRRYPDFAAELEAFLADYEHMDRLAAPLRPVATPGVPTPPVGIVSGVAATPGSRQPAGFSVGATIRYLGDYELVEEIARGGMGVVYKARQISLNRIVAVKMILAGLLATKADRDRFHSEAQAAALLDHPNIVPIFEIGKYEGQHYFSMGYVDGQSLATRLVEGPLAPREAAELAATVAEAVEYAHRQGVIHRDIKPSNVLIDCKGRPRVTDFGLAKQVGGGSDLTATGQVLGTPSYMPPEQATGQVNAVSPAADVYSLGALLYAMLVGRPPFQAAIPVETLRQVIENEPVALRQLDPGVPRDLETIVLKCLEKAIPRRYATAQALADDLRRYLDGLPILARPVGRWEHAWRWCRRQPVVTGLIATAALLLVAVAVVGIVGYVRTSQALGIVETQRNRVAEALEKVLRGERAEAELYAFQIQQAQREYLAENYNRAAARLLDCPPNLRCWEWNFLTNLCNLAPRTASKHSKAASSVAFSPNGQQVASGGAEGLVKVWDVVQGKDSFVLDGHTGAVSALAFRRDGGLLASGDESGAVKVWDAKTGGIVLSLAAKEGPAVAQLAFSKDGSRLVGYFDKLGYIPRRALKSARERQMELLNSKVIYRDLVSETAKESGTALTKAHVRVWRVADGRELFTQPVAGSLNWADVDDEAEQVFIQGPDDKLRVWHVSTGQMVWETEISDTKPGKKPAEMRSLIGEKKFSAENVWTQAPLRCSRDGKLVALRDPDGFFAVWDIVARRPRFKVKAGPGVFSIAFDNRGERVAADDWLTLRVYDSVTGKELLKEAREGNQPSDLLAPPEVPPSPAAGRPQPCRLVFVKGGQWIASTARDGTVKVFDAATGSEILSFSHNFVDTVFGNDFFSPHSVAFAGASNWVASLDRDGSVKVRPILSKRDRDALVSPDGPIVGLAYRPDGHALATVGGGNVIRTWDLSCGRESTSMRGNDSGMASGLRAVAYSSDGVQIASAGTDVLVWNPARGNEPLVLRCDATSVAFSPDGQRVIAGCLDNTVKVWTTTDNRLVTCLKGHSGSVNAVVFSSDGRRIVSGSSDGTARVWDSSTGKNILWLRGHRGPVNAVALAGKGDRIVTGSDDTTAKIWDAVEGRELLTLQGHTGPIMGIAFSPDGKRIATASADKTIRIWDATTGRELILLQRHTGAVKGIAFRPDGMELATSDSEGVVRLWKCTAASGGLNELVDFEHLGAPRPQPVQTQPDTTSRGALGPQEDAPRVRIVSPRDGEVVKSTAKLIASIYTPKATDSLRVSVYANGANVTTDDLAKRALLSGGELSYDTQVTLPRDPRLLLQVVVHDSTGVATYSRVRLEQPEPGPRPRTPRLYVVALGIDKFRDPKIQPLNSPANDARAVAQALATGAHSLYDVTKPILLIDEEVTPERFRKVLEGLRRNIEVTAMPDDLIVIYLAGRGILYEQPLTRRTLFCYPGYDMSLADFESGKAYPECISWDDLQQLASVRCRKLVVVDACHAGGIRPVVRRPGDDVIVTLVACGTNGLAAERDKHGLFTEAFLAAIEGRGPSEQEEGRSDDVIGLNRVISTIQKRCDHSPDILGRFPPEAGPAELLPYLYIPLTKITKHDPNADPSASKPKNATEHAGVSRDDEKPAGEKPASSKKQGTFAEAATEQE